jgi:hypothetical protein
MCKWEHNVRMYLKEMGVDSAQYMDYWRANCKILMLYIIII